MQIQRGNVKSKRHTLYFSPEPDARNHLEQMRGFGPITDDEKVCSIPYSPNFVQWCQRIMEWSQLIIAHVAILC